MGTSQDYRQSKTTYCLYAIGLCIIAVLVLETNWEATSAHSSLFHGGYQAKNYPGEHLEISWNSDIRGLDSKPCLPYIFYDKPVKTASTTVTRALKDYFISTGQKRVECGKRDECNLAIESICLGIRPPGHLVDHVSVNSSMVECLHDIGYYHVTSIRDPKARILSVFKYNRATPGNSNGIPRNASFEEFLEKYPRCALFSYYDHLSSTCGSDKRAIEERAERIANRMDEIIDVTEYPASDVHGRVSQYLGMLNVVQTNESFSSDSDIPDEVAESEYVLYNKLRRRRKELLRRQQGRRLCNFKHVKEIKPHAVRTYKGQE